MKLPLFTRLQKDITGSADKFILVLNRWFENISNVLRNLTFEDNFRAQFVTFDVGADIPPIDWSQPTPPRHVLVTAATGAGVSSLPALEWSFDGQKVTITKVVGAVAPATISLFILGE